MTAKMRYFILFLSIFFTSLILSGCSHIAPPPPSPPTWYGEGASSMVGYGYDKDKEGAEKKAREHLKEAFKRALLKEIKSELFYSLLEIDNYYTNIDRKFDISDGFIEITNIASNGGYYYARAALKEEVYAKLIMKNMNDMLARIIIAPACGAEFLGLKEFNMTYLFLRDVYIRRAFLHVMGYNFKLNKKLVYIKNIYMKNYPLPRFKLELNYSEMPLDKQLIIQHGFNTVFRGYITPVNYKYRYRIVATTLVYNGGYNFIVTFNNCRNQIVYQFNFRLPTNFNSHMVESLLLQYLRVYIDNARISKLERLLSRDMSKDLRTIEQEIAEDKAKKLRDKKRRKHHGVMSKTGSKSDDAKRAMKLSGAMEDIDEAKLEKLDKKAHASRSRRGKKRHTRRRSRGAKVVSKEQSAVAKRPRPSKEEMIIVSDTGSMPDVINTKHKEAQNKPEQVSRSIHNENIRGVRTPFDPQAASTNKANSRANKQASRAKAAPPPPPPPPKKISHDVYIQSKRGGTTSDKSGILDFDAKDSTSKQKARGTSRAGHGLIQVDEVDNKGATFHGLEGK